MADHVNGSFCMKESTKKYLKEGLMLRVFGIGTKAGIAVILFSAALIFAAVKQGAYIHMLSEISGNIQGDYMIDRILARTLDQEICEDVFERGRKIYDSIPEDTRKDPLDPGYLSNFDELDLGEKYLDLQQQLMEVRDECAVDWIALAIIDEETDRIIYLLDSTVGDDDSFSAGYWQYRSDLINTVFDVGDSFQIDFQNTEYMGIMDNLLNSSDPEMKKFCTYAPFYHKDTGETIGYIGIGESWGVYEQDMASFMAAFVLILSIISVLIIIVITVITRQWLVKPIRRLTKATREYGRSGEKDSNKKFFANLKVRSHDEIRILAQSMSDMEEDLSNYMDNLTTMTAEKERMSTELDVAEKIQKSMLPVSLVGYEGPKDFELSSYIKPAKEVAGDFYDYFVIDEDRLGLTVADVSGKGMPAALFMVVAKNLIKNLAMSGLTASEVIASANKQLCDNNSETMFATVWFAIYSVSGHSLKYVNAGHENPIIYRAAAGSYEIIEDEHDVVLGFDPDLTYNEIELKLEPGDRLLQYTDGIPEATTSDERMYGMAKMLEFLNSHKELSGFRLLEEFKRDVDGFVGEAPQFDDITMLLLEINKTV